MGVPARRLRVRVPAQELPAVTCVHCGVPVPHAEADVKHGPGCPSTTNLWPVTPGHVAVGACCSRCSGQLALGDFYVRLRLAVAEDGRLVHEVVCVACAAAAVCLA